MIGKNYFCAGSFGSPEMKNGNSVAAGKLMKMYNIRLFVLQNFFKLRQPATGYFSGKGNVVKMLDTAIGTEVAENQGWAAVCCG